MILIETNRCVQIRACDGGELWLTPLGTRQFTDDVVQRFRLECWTETLTAETSANKRTKQADGDRKRAHRLHRVLRGSGGQQLYLAGSILLGAVLPAALIYFAADGGRLLHLLTSTSARQAAAQSAPITEHDVMVTLLGRGLQIAFVMVAALLPALLYLLFDHEHLDTLRQRFTRQIMRFDPALRTRKDVVAKYGNLMNEAYGRDSTGKILPGRRSPLLLATFTVTLGWSFTLLHGTCSSSASEGSRLYSNRARLRSHSGSSGRTSTVSMDPPRIRTQGSTTEDVHGAHGPDIHRGHPCVGA